MEFSAPALFASLVVSTVGLGFFLYGKRQTRFPQLVTGLVLMIYPYFVHDALGQLAIAAGLLAAMWLVLRLEG